MIKTQNLNKKIENECRAIRVILGIGGGMLNAEQCVEKIMQNISEKNKNTQLKNNLSLSATDIWFIIGHHSGKITKIDKENQHFKDSELVPFYFSALFCVLYEIRVKKDKIDIKALNELYLELKMFLSELNTCLISIERNAIDIGDEIKANRVLILESSVCIISLNLILLYEILNECASTVEEMAVLVQFSVFEDQDKLEKNINLILKSRVSTINEKFLEALVFLIKNHIENKKLGLEWLKTTKKFEIPETQNIKKAKKTSKIAIFLCFLLVIVVFVTLKVLKNWKNKKQEQ